MAKEDLSAEEVKEAEVLALLNSNKKKYKHLALFARRYLLAPPSSVYIERLFQKLVTCTNKSEIDYFKNRGKTLISPSQLKKHKTSMFCSLGVV